MPRRVEGDSPQIVRYFVGVREGRRAGARVDGYLASGSCLHVHECPSRLSKPR